MTSNPTFERPHNFLLKDAEVHAKVTPAQPEKQPSAARSPHPPLPDRKEHRALKSRSPKLLIFLTVFVDLLGFGIVIPILPAIARSEASGPHAALLVGLMMSSFSLFQMIFAPIWGRLSDRVGRRPVIVVSLFGSVVAYTMFAFARSYEVLIISRIFAGICGANLAAAQAYLADVSKPEERTSAMGLIGMAFGLGFVGGPIIGAGASQLGEAIQPGLAAQTYPGIAAAAICLANLVWAVVGLPESLTPERRAEGEKTRRYATFSQVTEALRHRTIGPLILVFFLLTFAFSNLEMAFVLYAKDEIDGLGLSITQIYYLFIYLGLVLAFSNGYVVRKASKIVPESILVIVGASGQVAGLLLLPVFPTVANLLIAIGLISFGQGICNPSLLSLISKATPPERQGSIMGVTQSSASLARIIGPAFAGIIIGALDLRWPFWAGGLIMISAVALAIVSRKRILDSPIQPTTAPAEPG